MLKSIASATLCENAVLLGTLESTPQLLFPECTRFECPMIAGLQKWLVDHQNREPS